MKLNTNSGALLALLVVLAVGFTACDLSQFQTDADAAITTADAFVSAIPTIPPADQALAANFSQDAITGLSCAVNAVDETTGLAKAEALAACGLSALLSAPSAIATQAAPLVAKIKTVVNGLPTAPPAVTAPVPAPASTASPAARVSLIYVSDTTAPPTAPPASIARDGFTTAQLQPIWKAIDGSGTCQPGGGPYELFDMFEAYPGGPCGGSGEEQYRDTFMFAWAHGAPGVFGNPGTILPDSAYIAEAAAIYNAPAMMYTNLELAFLAKMFASEAATAKPATPAPAATSKVLSASQQASVKQGKAKALAHLAAVQAKLDALKK